jgi:hypothetical protein
MNDVRFPKRSSGGFWPLFLAVFLGALAAIVVACGGVYAWVSFSIRSNVEKQKRELREHELLLEERNKRIDAANQGP